MCVLPCFGLVTPDRAICACIFMDVSKSIGLADALVVRQFSEKFEQ